MASHSLSIDQLLNMTDEELEAHTEAEVRNNALVAATINKARDRNQYLLDIEKKTGGRAGYYDLDNEVHPKWTVTVNGIPFGMMPSHLR